jgi:hypothetical protein
MRNDENQENKLDISEMHKRRETMADGKRYIIYYTFGESAVQSGDNAPKSEETQNV